MRNELQAAIDRLEENVEYLEEVIDDQTTRSMVLDEALKDIPAFTVALSALRDALKRAEGCDTCLKGKAHFGDVLWAINKDGKAVININGEQTNTVFRHCPMCGRKLTAPPPSGAIGPETGEMAPNGDEGAEL
jgi:hypothetical protein